ncbi:MAG: hypothetical protein IJT61_03990 [Bacteroidales bacterium]|nr:hypothetical protein [Bacteroidales bacterium]
MEVTLSSRQMDELAYKTAVVLAKLLKKQDEKPDLVPTNEAARILGITPDRLRHIVCQDPTRYPHVKRGDSSRSRLMFVRDALLQ